MHRRKHTLTSVHKATQALRELHIKRWHTELGTENYTVCPLRPRRTKHSCGDQDKHSTLRARHHTAHFKHLACNLNKHSQDIQEVPNLDHMTTPRAARMKTSMTETSTSMISSNYPKTTAQRQSSYKTASGDAEHANGSAPERKALESVVSSEGDRITLAAAVRIPSVATAK